MVFSRKKHIIALEGFEKIIEDFSTFLKYQTIYLQTRLKRSDHFRRTDIYKLTFERSFWSSGSGRPIQRFRSFLIKTTNETTICQTDLQRFIEKKENY